MGNTSVVGPARIGIIIPAAGSGVRLGEPLPKAFVDLHGATILETCVSRILASEVGAAALIVVVVPVELLDDARSRLPGVVVVAGGAHRSESVRAGLAALDDDVDIVLVHDAARPLTPADVFARVIAAVASGHQAVVPGLPVPDTLKLVVPGDSGTELVRATVDREPLRAVQTPQGFRRDALTRAHADDSGLATDDAGLAERIGIAVHVVPGDHLAFKITTPWDLRIARDVLGAESNRAESNRAEPDLRESDLKEGSA